MVLGVFLWMAMHRTRITTAIALILSNTGHRRLRYQMACLALYVMARCSEKKSKFISEEASPLAFLKDSPEIQETFIIRNYSGLLATCGGSPHFFGRGVAA